MAIEIVVPRLGWSMDEGTFSEWLKKDGEFVKKGDMLFVLEGEKAAQEIESFDDGILRIGGSGPQPGQTVKVGQVIGYLLAEGEQLPISSPPAASATASTSAARPIAGPAVRRLARRSGIDLQQVSGTGRGGRITPADVQSITSPAGNNTGQRTSGDALISTPRARRAAGELGVSLTEIAGTGRGGRIRERDVRSRALQTGDGARTQSIRKTIAARMMASFHGTAPVTLTTRADASNLEVWRKRSKEAAAAGQLVPSLTDLLIRSCIQALHRHPYMNARWEHERAVPIAEFNIGLAVDTPAGLLVPVLRDAGRLSAAEIAERTRELASRAREGKLSLREMQGGTFTITNLGMFGIDAFTPIINAPEIAILGIGALRREPVFVADDRVEARQLITLSLTFDHRAVDGAPAARFLQTLCQTIENAPASLEHRHGGNGAD